PDASGGEPCGAGVAGGGSGPAQQQGCVGWVPAADEGAAGGPGGLDGDGAQAGADRLPGAEARDDVRPAGPGGVRGADEGEAGQGVAAEGAAVGAGGGREAAGQRSDGNRGAGAGVRKGRGERPVGQGRGSGGSVRAGENQR